MWLFSRGELPFKTYVCHRIGNVYMWDKNKVTFGWVLCIYRMINLLRVRSSTRERRPPLPKRYGCTLQVDGCQPPSNVRSEAGGGSRVGQSLKCHPVSFAGPISLPMMYSWKKEPSLESDQASPSDANINDTLGMWSCKTENDWNCICASNDTVCSTIY